MSTVRTDASDVLQASDVTLNELGQDGSNYLIEQVMQGFHQETAERSRVADLCQLHLYNVAMCDQVINMWRQRWINARDDSARRLSVYLTTGKIPPPAYG